MIVFLAGLALAQVPPDQRPERPNIVSNMATLRVGSGMVVTGDGPGIGLAGAVGGRIEIDRWGFFAEADGLLAFGPAPGFRLGGQIGLHHILFARGGGTPYFGGGLGVGGGWFGGDDTTWIGGGFETHLSGGYEVLRLTRDYRLFFQGDIVFPVYLATETVSEAEQSYSPGIFLTMGLGYKP